MSGFKLKHFELTEHEQQAVEKLRKLINGK